MARLLPLGLGMLSAIAAAAADEPFCCQAATEGPDICGTCWPGARIGASEPCGGGAKSCEDCGLTWCGAAATAAHGGGGGSCAAYGCGEYSRAHQCQCNAECAKYKNCCHDFEDCGGGGGGGGVTLWAPAAAPGRSCDAYGCGMYDRAHPCQCNAECHRYKNCCHDFEDQCPHEAFGEEHLEEVILRSALPAAAAVEEEHLVGVPLALGCALLVMAAAVVSAVGMSVISVRRWQMPAWVTGDLPGWVTGDYEQMANAGHSPAPSLQIRYLSSTTAEEAAVEAAA